MSLKHKVLALTTIWLPVAAMSQEEATPYSELAGRVIENIFVEADDVFDTRNDAENNALFDVANRLHVDTRASTVLAQLLFKSGDEFSSQKLEESERILRAKAYLFDASLTPVAKENGAVDILVKTRDNWTLFPEFTFSRTGGESESSFGIEEQNLFGTGTRLNLRREKDADRTSSVFEFSGSEITDYRLSIDYAFSDLSDGKSQLVRVQRPFFSLDTKWAGGVTLFADDRVDSLYSAGERSARYRKDQAFTSVFYGISQGLVDGWSKRWVVGFVSDERDFDSVIEPDLIEVTPENRHLNYPYVRYQHIQDRYQKTENLNQIGRTEDIYLGEQLQFTVGYASEGFGSDRNAWILATSYQRGFGSADSTLVLATASTEARLESGGFQNSVFRNRVELYKRQNEKRVLYLATSLRVGDALDLDNYVGIGGDTGLRGYPTDYLNAETTALFSAEQRFYTDYYPLRLYRVGAAMFFDAARGWGEDTTGFKDDDLLMNVGFGLRFASTRSSNNRVFHFDIAFPINRPEGIDSVQFQITGKRRF